MEAIDVRARRNAKGEILPESFEFHQQLYTVDSVGRRWKDKAGEHVLVRVRPARQVFELVYREADNGWRLARSFKQTNKV